MFEELQLVIVSACIGALSGIFGFNYRNWQRKKRSVVDGKKIITLAAEMLRVSLAVNVADKSTVQFSWLSSYVDAIFQNEKTYDLTRDLLLLQGKIVNFLDKKSAVNETDLLLEIENLCTRCRNEVIPSQ